MMNPMKTCFENCRLLNQACKNTECRHSIKNDSSLNCLLLAVKPGQTQTLADIGKVFDLTRMRICQIEKGAVAKVKEENA